VSERVLTARELNRALLARQLLLERSDLPVAGAIEQVGGLQTQYSPSGYIGLWSRVRDFRRESLTESLEDRSVIQATMMRATIHMASAADYPLMAAATRAARAEWWLRTMRKELDGMDMTAVAAATRSILAGGPVAAAEIQARLAAMGYPRIAWASVAQWLDMVRVPPSGTWARRKADLYGLAEQWLGPAAAQAGGAAPADGGVAPAPASGGAPAAGSAATAPAPAPGAIPAPKPATAERGLELLIRRYLGGFGPAPVADVASWAGLPVATVRPAIERLDLRRFCDGRGRVLFDLRDAPLPDADTPAPIRFLPTWDATLLIHARRTEILSEEHRSLIFSAGTPHSVPTFLVDGRVAGTWRYDRGRVEVSPFEPLPAAEMAELHDEADRLAAFHAA
jgi:hypothetical protein